MTPPTKSDNLFYNFTRINGNIIVDKILGPLIDHTTNTIEGYFLYWNYTLPYRPNIIGQIITPHIETDVKMCLQFSYYVKSLDNLKSTQLSIDDECTPGLLWNQAIADTDGWQTVTIELQSSACTNTITFKIQHRSPVAIAFALDDIIIDRCYTFENPSTTTTTAKSTITSTRTIPSQSTSLLTKTSATKTNSITSAKSSTRITTEKNNSIGKKINHKTFFVCIWFILFYFL
jgi:hypothetical protein